MKSSRRDFVKSAALVGIGLPSTPSFFINKSNPVKGSNRELMMEFMDKDSRSNHIPGGFFMHFNKKGDEAVKAHLDYYKATKMDFVKIQFDGMSLPLMPEIKQA
ncbi:MAG: hypothetical protein RI995_267, partial [Bacteroidota bacterium]